LGSDGPQSPTSSYRRNYCIGFAGVHHGLLKGSPRHAGRQSRIVNGYKCIGHSLLAEVWPGRGHPPWFWPARWAGTMALLTPEFETTIKDMYIVGEWRLGASHSEYQERYHSRAAMHRYFIAKKSRKPGRCTAVPPNV